MTQENSLQNAEDGSQQPTFAISAEAESFNIPIHAYIAANPPVAVVGATAAVFSTPSSSFPISIPSSPPSHGSSQHYHHHQQQQQQEELRILLVQRHPADFMPLKWEMPGGASEPLDRSLLHCATRELLEEAGLRATRLVRCVDEKSREFDDFPDKGSKRWRLVTFEVEVEVDDRGVVPVRLDPEEHVAFVWAAEEEVRRGRCGDVELDFPESTRDVVLRAFELRRCGSVV
jgi:8-oxo-dGTP pyrophosphatase MutT (NUDIX family)